MMMNGLWFDDETSCRAEKSSTLGQTPDPGKHPAMTCDNGRTWSTMQ